ncbi:MAG TPA: hypothetical protein VF623_07255 [Segetibacter sp.]
MREEKIRLPDFLLADLYKSSLVEITATTPDDVVVKTPEPIKPATVAATDQIKYLEENGKKVTIIVNQPNTAFLNKDDLTFLTNILKACQLTLADISIVNIVTQQLTFQQLKEQLGSVYILLFDVEPSTIKLPFNIPAFQVQKFDDCTIMMAPTLSILNQPSADGRVLKTKLWTSLKQMFGI